MRNHILVVDDLDVVRSAFVLLLTEAGHEVAEAQDGREALDCILRADRMKSPFDLLVTDIRMPRMSGTELAEELRRRDIRLPVLFVSGVIDREGMQEELRHPHSDFLMKPFDVLELNRRVEALIAKWRLEKTARTCSDFGLDLSADPLDLEGPFHGLDPNRERRLS